MSRNKPERDHIRERDYIRIEEAGAVFEIFGNMPDGSYWMNITDASGELRSVDAKDWQDVCQQIDRWFEKHVAADDPHRFKGYRATIRNHETGLIEPHVFTTRGALLEVWTDGSIPALEDFVEHMECCGDDVILVQDGAGTLLADRREEVKIAMRRWMERDLDENLRFIDQAADEALSGDAPDAPAP